MKKSILVLSLLAFVLIFGGIRCSSSRKAKENEKPPQIITTNLSGKGIGLELEFVTGTSFKHPLMAVWVEDMDSNFIGDLYVAKSIATGIFDHGKVENGQWEPGERRRRAALPYWGHKRGIKAMDGLYLPDVDTRVPDALTGATPEGNFNLKTKSGQLPTGKIRILLEINQAWDWNRYWTNSKFPGDTDYETSGQPALVYEAIIDPDGGDKEYNMSLIGHSHHSGADGRLYKDLSTISTAKEIVGSAKMALRSTIDD